MRRLGSALGSAMAWWEASLRRARCEHWEADERAARDRGRAMAEKLMGLEPGERAKKVRSLAARSFALEALALPGRACYFAAVCAAFALSVALSLPTTLPLAALDRKSKWAKAREGFDALASVAGELALLALGLMPRALLWRRAERALWALDYALGKAALADPGLFEARGALAWLGANAHCHAAWACKFDDALGREMWSAQKACGLGRGGAWVGERGLTAWEDPRLMRSAMDAGGAKWALKWGRAPWRPAGADLREAAMDSLDSGGRPAEWARRVLAASEAAKIEPPPGPLASKRAPRL